MPLGVSDLKLIEDDLVKVIAPLSLGGQTIPMGTIAPVMSVTTGEVMRFQLKGFDGVYVCRKQIELVSYVRKNVTHIKHNSEINKII